MTRETASRPASPRRRRADAERNVAAIVEAALEGILAGDEVTMAALARAVGVSRVTLYSHFPTREALLDAVTDRAVTDARDIARELRLDDDPAREALARMVRSQWQTLSRYRNLYAVAVAELPPARLRALHTPLFGSVKKLITRGQAEGDFRTDLPQDWLLATVYALMHQAAEEVNAGRLSARKAGDTVTETILSALRAP
jgi:AcrR family transcriptional regulator